MGGLSRLRLGLWARMAVAAALCLLLLTAVVGGALLLVGLPVYGFVLYGAATLEAAVSTPAATTLVVAAAVVTLGCIECSLRAIRTAREDEGRPGPLAEGVVELAAYALLLSSIVIALISAPLASALLPTTVFVVLALFAFFYLLIMSYVWVGVEWVRSRNDDGLERSETSRWLVMGVFGVAYLSAAVSELFAGVLAVVLVGVGLGALVAPDRLDALRSRLVERAGEDADADYHDITEETRRLVRRLERAPGPRPEVFAAVCLPVLLGGVYAAATVRSTGTLAVALAAGAAVAFVGSHVGGALRGEFSGDIAVLRDLEDETGIERLGATAASAGLEATVARLAGQADVPTPDVRIADRATPTALTVGYRPESSTIVLSTGLLERLEERELEAVLAHEFAHVANRDAAVLTALAAPGAVARLTSGRYGFNPILEPLAVLVGTFSRWYVAFVSRAREYAADDGAIAITGDPAWLASALESLDDDLERRPDADLREGGLTTAFSIVPPPWKEHRFFDRTRRFVDRRLFGTHPPTEKRVDRLRSRVCSTD